MVISGLNTFVEYFVTAFEFATIGTLLYLDKESCNKLLGTIKRRDNLTYMKAPPHYRVELLSSLILFFIVGGQYCLGTYLNGFIELYAAGTDSTAVVYNYNADMLLLTGFTSASKFAIPFVQAQYPSLKQQMKILNISNFCATIGISIYFLDPQKSPGTFNTFLVINGIFTGGTAGVSMCVYVYICVYVCM